MNETIENMRAMADASVQDFILAFEDRTEVVALRVFAKTVIPVF